MIRKFGINRGLLKYYFCSQYNYGYWFRLLDPGLQSDQTAVPLPQEFNHTVHLCLQLPEYLTAFIDWEAAVELAMRLKGSQKPKRLS